MAKISLAIPPPSCRRSSRLRGVAVTAALASLLAGCGGEKKEGSSAAVRAPAVSVLVAPVIQETVPIYSEFTARTDSPQTVNIEARVPAFLEAQHFKEGTQVKKGQLLFTLDDREYRAKVQQAKASLAKAEADLAAARDRPIVQVAEANLEVAQAQLGKADQDVNRLKPLAEQQAVPQQDYDNALASQKAARADVEARKATLETSRVNQKTSIGEAEAAVESAKAAIILAELDLGYCQISSPIGGLAGTRQVAPGNLVGKGGPTLLVTVSSLDPIRVLLSISEAEYLQLVKKRRAGKPLELILADGSTFPHKGHIVTVDRAVDLKTGTLSLVAEFPNPDGLLRPGQFGRVRAAMETAENALLVPQKSVVEMQSAKIIYVVGPKNRVQLRTVMLGDRVGQNFIVTEGLKAGERIIVEGVAKVRPGEIVNPMDKPVSAERRGEN
jgi:membrane fusion protein (multidrug efflux system)